MKYVALIAKTGNGFSAHLPDLPGCVAAAETFEETKQLIEQAAGFHVEDMKESGEAIPVPTYVAVEVDVPHGPERAEGKRLS